MLRKNILAVSLVIIAQITQADEKPVLQTTDPQKGEAMMSPSDYLQAQKKPVFSSKHTLMPLTRYGWTLPYDTRVELAENWGYCLEFGGYVTEKTVEKLKDPKSLESKLVALTASDPEKYPLFVICSRRLPTKEAPAATWSRDANGKLLNAQAKSLDGTEWNKGMKLVYSPEAPDSMWKQAGKYRADPIKAVHDKCPIAIVLNGGEYGLGVLGFAQKVWQKDPAVLKAKGDKNWFDYISERKAHAETLIADEVKAVTPDRKLYIFYPGGACPHRNRYGGWYKWCWDYREMAPVSDLPSCESYYQHFNTGWTGDRDQLTMILNARGYEIACGKPLSYNWLSGGWPRGKDKTSGLCEIPFYMGFLKCFYTAGMVGGNAGYYAYPKGGFGVKFKAGQPPHWLQQIIAFSRVHALFSHLEDYLRNGDLLPGPNKHRWSKQQPAYEFPATGRGIRVLARKHRKKPEWLITAWATFGNARKTSTTIPGLGEIELFARPEGSVYIATLKDEKPSLTLIDKDGLFPTAGMK